MKFKHKNGNIRVEIHAPHVKGKNSAKYSHIHIIDKQGRPLDKNLLPVEYNSLEAHIKVEELVDLILKVKP